MKRTTIKFLCALFALWITVSPVFALNDDIYAWGGFGKKDNVYSCAKTDEKVIALTFDDGPHPSITPRILDILKKYDVKATFFAIGKNIETYPEPLIRAASEGHEIGNHTYSHLTGQHTNKETLEKELLKTDELIKKLTGKRPVLYRPPTGYCNLTTVKSAADLNYKIIIWTVDTLDWAHTSAEKIADNIISNIKNGSIVLMHDYNTKPYYTVEALEIVLPKLQDMGYSFVTVSELIALDCDTD